MKYKYVLLALVSVVFAAPLNARAADAPRQIVQLLDYLGRDYAGAVSNGAVISEMEYREQIEFAEQVLADAKSVPVLSGDPAFMAEIDRLQKLIDSKAPAAEVGGVTRDLRTRAIRLTKLVEAPAQYPDVSNGKKIFEKGCTDCHGGQGLGDGPAGAGLEPKPSNFHDPVLIAQLTPFQAYNAIRNGIQGTGMKAADHLTDQEAWDAAFYVFSLRYTGKEQEDLFSRPFNEALPSLNDLATLTDDALVGRLKGSDEAENRRLVAALRSDPVKVLQSQTRLSTARSLLDAALTSYQGGRVDDAKQQSLLAYLDGVEPFEVRLKTRDAEIVPRLEADLQAVRASISQGRAQADVLHDVEAARSSLTRAEEILSDAALSYGAVLATSALIVLREGFEAVLIVVALLAVLRKLKATQARRWAHLGWTSAIAAGFVTWFVSEKIFSISGAQREVMEGITGLVAVVILVYMGMWLHGQSEIRKWAAFVNLQARQAVANQKFATFFGVSFLAVYREAFETVLFYRALALDTTPTTQSALLMGLMIGAVAIGILTWAMLAIGARIPLQRFMQVSAMIIFALTVVVLGKGLHALQEAAWVTTNSFPLNIRVDILGIFPTYETIGAQAVLIGVLFGLQRLLRRMGESKSRANATPAKTNDQ